MIFCKVSCVKLLKDLDWVCCQHCEYYYGGHGQDVCTYITQLWDEEGDMLPNLVFSEIVFPERCPACEEDENSDCDQCYGCDTD